MKKIAGWLSFILLVSLFTGCGRQETDDPAYHIYYLNKEKTKVVEQPYDLKEGKTEDMIATLLDALCTNTDSVEYQKPVPGDVTITDCHWKAISCSFTLMIIIPKCSLQMRCCAVQQW